MTAKADPDFDFRSAKPEEMTMIGRLLKYTFADPSEPEDPREFGLKPEQTFCAFDGDTLASCAGALAFELAFNGKTVKADGLTVVSTDPGYRRKGLVRNLMTQQLHTAHKNGMPISILWASMGALYQRYGYGYATNWNEYKIDPKQIVFETPTPETGSVRRLSREDGLDIAKELYVQAIEGHTLSIKRSNTLWKFALPAEEKKKRELAVYFDADGTPRGYLIYTVKGGAEIDGGPDQLIRVVDFVWTDMASYRGLWNFLASHDLAKEIKCVFMPDDGPAESLLLEPRALHKSVADGIWLRIVDVDKTLEARGYNHDGEVTIAVKEDDICPWNVGTWKLSVKNGDGIVEKTDGKPDIQIGVTALASLVCGYSTASLLERTDRLTCEDKTLLPKLDALFSTRFRPNCTNMF
jgi:predicted acetyltransferase